MRRKKVSPFVLIVVDADKRIFTVEGPMKDDTEWNSAVVQAQEQKRQVTCHIPGNHRRADVEAAANAYAQHSKFKRVAHGSIVLPGRQG